MPIEFLGLDADDTLWHSERVFHLTEQRFADLLAPWLGEGDVATDRLLATERRNLGIFGYGVKGFALSMVETAVEVSGGEVTAAQIQQILDWAKDMMQHPVELLDGVADTIGFLAERVQLVLVTKGDLFHQQGKIAESGLADHFWRIEVVAEKDEDTYRSILERHGIRPDRFLMAGNSVKSDILPILDLGGHGAHIPYQYLWGMERAEPPLHHDRFHPLSSFAELPALLAAID